MRWAAVGMIALAGSAVASMVIVVGATERRNVLVPGSFRAGLPAWMKGPLGALASGVLTPGALARLLLGMTACYAIALACSRSIPERWAVATIVVLHAIVLLGPPLLSADVFGYLDFARMGALHHLNPYTHVSASVHADAIHPYVRWHRLTSPYGPLFTLGTYPLAELPIPRAFWILKVLAAASSLGGVALIRHCARRLGRPTVPAMLLMGANPLVLLYAVAGAHNDLLMMLVAMGGVALVLARRETAGASALIVAAGLKASVGLLAPFAVLGSRARGRMTVAMAATAAVIGLLGLLVFGPSGIDVVGVVRSQQGQVSGASVPRQLGILLGAGGLTAGLRIAAAAGLALTAVVMLVRTHRGADWLAAAGWSTFALLLATAWLLPWYVVWLLPIAAIASSSRLRYGALALTVYITVVHSIHAVL